MKFFNKLSLLILLLLAVPTISWAQTVNGDVESRNSVCWGDTSGSITITNHSGGGGTFEFSYDNGNTWYDDNATNDANGALGIVEFRVRAGVYKVLIRDKNNTTDFKLLDGSRTITQPTDWLRAQLIPVNPSICGSPDGEIRIRSAFGGTLANGQGNYEFRITSRTTGMPVVYSDEIPGSGGWHPEAGGDNNRDFIDLGADTFMVEIRERVSGYEPCVVVLHPAIVLINHDTTLAATVTSENVTNCGLADGAIRATGAVGSTTANYEFLIITADSLPGSGAAFNTGWLAENLDNGYENTTMGPGVYDVWIRNADNTGCAVKIGSRITITMPNNLNAQVTSVNVTVCGSNNGSIKIASATGSPDGNYEFAVVGSGGFPGPGDWQGEANPADDSLRFTGLVAGSYDVYIRRASGFTGDAGTCWKLVRANVVLTQPNALAATVLGVNDTICGQTSGMIKLSALAGAEAPSLTYQAYYTVRDSAFGLPGFSFGPYSETGTDIIDISNVAAGSYDVYLQDANNPACIRRVRQNLVITRPDSLSAQLTTTNVTVCGGTNGTIVINNARGAYREAGFPDPAYEFGYTAATTPPNSGNVMNWTNETSAFSRSKTWADVVEGTYDIWMRDKNNPGCAKLLGTKVITMPNLLAAEVSVTNATLCGTYGLIDISNAEQAPTTVYEFAVATAGLFDRAVNRDRAIVPNEYRRHAPSYNDGGNIDNVLTDGVVVASQAGDTLTNGNWFFSGWRPEVGNNRHLLDSIPAGTYDVFIRDANSPLCIRKIRAIELGAGRGPVTVTEGSSLAANVTATNPTGCASGDAKVTITGATGASTGNVYEFLVVAKDSMPTHGQLFPYPCSGWRGELSSNDEGYEFEGGLPANWPDYDVYIRDGNEPQCIKKLTTVTITAPAPLGGSFTKVEVSLCEGNNGSITATPSGASFRNGYWYVLESASERFGSSFGPTWGQYAPTFGNLTEGTYNLYIGDPDPAISAPNCLTLIAAGIEITDNNAINFDVTTTDNGDNTGDIIITNATGAQSGTYEFNIGGALWETELAPTDNGYTYENVAAGAYTVTVRENGNTDCSSSKSVTVVVGIDNEVSEVLTVYPNPNSGVFTVKATGVRDNNITVEVTDVVGKVVFSKKVTANGFFTETIEMTNAPSGIYLVKVAGQSGISTTKIVKN